MIIRPLFVHLLPALFEPEAVRGGIAVILDILRASTTIVHALAHGAREVVPTVSIEEAVETADRLAKSHSPNSALPAAEVLLGGEREGVHIPGFQLDNNPFAYQPEIVRDKTVVFTTTNGTKALLRARAADRILIGAFVNLRAIAATLAADSRPVHLVCAGTKGKITLEDVLCAGAIADQLLKLSPNAFAVDDDQLQLSLSLYREHASSPDSLREALRLGFGGRNCLRLGFAEQVDRAGTCDLFSIVPEFQHQTGAIKIGNM